MSREHPPGADCAAPDDDGPEHHPTGPGQAAQARRRYVADPAAQLHPNALGHNSLQAMTSSRPRLHLGSGDSRPPVPRPGSLDLAALPSRMGNTLRWPDGRVTLINTPNTSEGPTP